MSDSPDYRSELLRHKLDKLPTESLFALWSRALVLEEIEIALGDEDARFAALRMAMVCDQIIAERRAEP